MTLEDLKPGASYWIYVSDVQFFGGDVDHKVSSPFEMTVHVTVYYMFT